MIIIQCCDAYSCFKAIISRVSFVRTFMLTFQRMTSCCIFSNLASGEDCTSATSAAWPWFRWDCVQHEPNAVFRPADFVSVCFWKSTHALVQPVLCSFLFEAIPKEPVYFEALCSTPRGTLLSFLLGTHPDTCFCSFHLECGLSNPTSKSSTF